MSKCPACLEQLCRRHPLQDHGARAAKLVAKAAELGTVGSKSANDLIQLQIEKLRSGAQGTTDEEQEIYRLNLERDRKNAAKRKRKNLSSEYLDLASKSGLHASVLSTMMARSSDEYSSDSSESENKKKSSEGDKKKNSKKERKGKKDKKNKKDRKYKKRKETQPLEQP